nr:uncharacterized protein CTRU02_07508 [Colletotrichum truncatum]KAF6791168.1 hypothetical protein CTRU02_07508 [Colletotrichum truncatum]
MDEFASSSKPARRQRSQLVLLNLAYALAFFSGVVQIFTLAAGKWVTENADGSQHLGLSSLSIFDGIVPSPSNPDSYLLSMHFFLSSFGYEYPNTSTAAIVSSEPRLPQNFIYIGEKLGVSSSSWACLRGSGQCTSSFYEAFRNDSFIAPSTLTYFAHIYALSVLALLMIFEVLIAVRPSWLRCQCYFSCLKRVCPCPRGSREEIEALPASFWNRYRMWMWPVLPLVIVLTAFALVMSGLLLKSYVNRPRAGNTNAHFGTGFIVIETASVAASFIAVICIYVRWILSRKVNWMEQQGAIAEGDTNLTSGRSPLQPHEYTDAEPGASLSLASAPLGFRGEPPRVA